MKHSFVRACARAVTALVVLLAAFVSFTVLPDGARHPAHADAASESQFVSLAPTPLLDTRDGTGTTSAGRVPAHGSVTFQVTGRAGIPATGVSAVALNLIALNPAKFGWFTLYPSDQPTTASTLTYAGGETVVGEDFTRLTSTGKVTVVNNSDGDVGIAIATDGYFRDAADVQNGNEYYPLASDYLYDTRPGLSTGVPARTTPVAAHSTVTFQVTGQAGIPATGVTAVAIGVGAMDHTSKGWLSVYPSDQADPNVSSVDFNPGETDQSFEVSRLTGTGMLTINNHGAGTVNISVTVRGYFKGAAEAGGAGYKPVPTEILVNTVTGVGTPGGSKDPIAPGASITLDASSRSGTDQRHVAAAALNINARQPTEHGGLSVYPAGTPDPGIASVAFDKNGETTNGFDLSIPGDDGKTTITNHSTGTIHIQVTVRGYALWSDTDLGGGPADDQACFDEVKRIVEDGAFNCVGNMLYYSKPQAPGQAAEAGGELQWMAHDLDSPDAPDVPVQDSAPITGDSTNDPFTDDAESDPLAAPADEVTSFRTNWDTWCEGRDGKTCKEHGRNWPYHAYLKANCTYGWKKGSRFEEWGRFDVMWDQKFHGAWNRYRMGVIWDSGLNFYVDSLRAFVRESKDGTDPTWGRLPETPNKSVDEQRWKFWVPSSPTEYKWVSEAVPYRNSGGRKPFHDDLDGSFWAKGYKIYMGKYHLYSFKTIRNGANYRARY